MNKMLPRGIDKVAEDYGKEMNGKMKIEDNKEIKGRLEKITINGKEYDVKGVEIIGSTGSVAKDDAYIKEGFSVERYYIANKTDIYFRKGDNMLVYFLGEIKNAN